MAKTELDEVALRLLLTFTETEARQELQNPSDQNTVANRVSSPTNHVSLVTGVFHKQTVKKSASFWLRFFIPGRDQMSKKAVAKKKVVKKAVAQKTKPKRYTATPTGTNDRQHLIAVIQKGTNCSSKAATETFNSLVGTITASLKKNQKVQLTGFGSFTVTKRPARKGRNPATGETIRIKATKVVRFKSGQTLKNSV